MSVNKSLVSTFLLLQKYDEDSNKFTKLANLYGTLKFNDKLLMKFLNDYKQNSNDISKLTYFKSTNINKVLINMSIEDKQIVISNLQNAFKFAEQSIIMGDQKEHTCNVNCNHSDEHLEKMFGSKKMKKLLKKNSVRQQLQKHFNMKNASIEDMLKSALKDNLPENEASMMTSILNNPMVKKISNQLLTEENLNKMKDIFMDFISSEEVVDEINKIKNIFNEQKVMKVVTELFGKIQNLDDISNIQSMVENNTDIIDIVNKFEQAMKSGLINEERLAILAQKAIDKFISEFKNMGILDGKNIGILKTLMSQFGGDNLLGFESEKKLTKQERRTIAQKKYRRNKRTELKKKKKKKKRRRS